MVRPREASPFFAAAGPGIALRSDGTLSSKLSLYVPVALVRPGYRGTAWARGVAEMASAIAEGRPHRASAEQAAHVVDILDAAARSIADGGRAIEIRSTFETPPLMPWAT